MAVNLQIRQVYSFEVYPVAILGNNYRNATVVAVMDRETANKEIDTQALHVSLYPYLPPGTPNDPNGYDYVKIKMPSGETTVLGIAWIKPETVQLVESRVVTVKIANVSASDIVRIKNALVQNGFTSINVSID